MGSNSPVLIMGWEGGREEKRNTEEYYEWEGKEGKKRERESERR